MERRQGYNARVGSGNENRILGKIRNTIVTKAPSPVAMAHAHIQGGTRLLRRTPEVLCDMYMRAFVGRYKSGFHNDSIIRFEGR